MKINVLKNEKRKKTIKQLFITYMYIYLYTIIIVIILVSLSLSRGL